MKVQGFSLVRNLPKKNGKYLFDSKCKAVRVGVVLKDVSA
jgi:hypothetical protein